jgi:TolB-like protein/Flp pilus assembly protein TadD
MDIEGFTHELKRRGVIRAAGWYAIVSWILMLAVSMTVPILFGPTDALKPMYALALIGLPIWCGGAWLLGADRAPEPEAAGARLGGSGVALLAVVAVLLVASAVLVLRGPAPRPAAARSIAVLPFTSLSADPADGYFAEGVHGDIITQLARVAELKVISRSSVLPYRGSTRNLREIAAELGVATVLEGSVRRADGRVRITAQLVDASTDSNLWAESYDRELTDVFAIQSEVAAAITHALSATLTETEKAGLAERPTTDAEAYDLYLRGRDYASRAARTDEDWANALAMFDQAVARDPNFAHAHAAAAQLHARFYWFGRDRTPARLALARAAADAALRAAPGLPQAHLALGYYHYHGFRDYPQALAEFEIARRSAPNDAEAIAAIGYVQRRLSQFDEALAQIDAAIARDPLNTLLAYERGLTLFTMRRYAEADQAYLRALALGPEDLTAASDRARMHFLWQGDDAAFVETLAKAPPAAALNPTFAWARFERCLRLADATCARDAANPALPELLELQDLLVPRAFLQGHALRLGGDPVGARRAFGQARTLLTTALASGPDDARAWAAMALVRAALGEVEPSRAAAQRAVELVPVERDALLGASFLLRQAQVLAAIGDRDAAIANLERLLAIPAEISKAALAADPKWATLRADPRFIALVATPPPEG